MVSIELKIAKFTPDLEEISVPKSVNSHHMKIVRSVLHSDDPKSQRGAFSLRANATIFRY